MRCRHKSQFSPSTDSPQDTRFWPCKKSPGAFLVLVNIERDSISIPGGPQANTSIRKEVLTISQGKVILAAGRNPKLKDVIVIIVRDCTSRLQKGFRWLILVIIGPVNVEADSNPALNADEFPEAELCSARTRGTDPILICKRRIDIPIKIEVIILRMGHSSYT